MFDSRIYFIFYFLICFPNLLSCSSPCSYPSRSLVSLNPYLLPNSFDNCKSKWYPEIQHHAPNVPIILVGTKADLRNDANMLQQLQAKGLSVISKEQAEGRAREINAKCYMECSALTQEGLKAVFDAAINAAINKPKPKPKGKCSIM